MKKHFLLFAFWILAQLAANAQMTLVWSDEFDYTGLPDPKKWSYDVGAGGWGNNELEYYTDGDLKNASVANGVLSITALKPASGGYTSARLVSTLKGDWLYGRIEVKAKLMDGKGSWPAIWMLPTDWAYGNWPASGEIDIMEQVGYDPTNVHGSLHMTNNYGGNSKTGTLSVPDCQSAFHVYAVEWSETQISFFVDNNKYYTYNRPSGYTSSNWPFDKRFHLLLNMAVGGNWGGIQGVDDASFPWTMQVDYVRVYQNTGFKLTGPSSVAPNQKGVTFQASSLTNATYNWTVPSDAKIQTGQGTSTITVDWGTTEGSVAVSTTQNSINYTASLPIVFAYTPTTDPYIADDFNDGTLNGITVSSDASNTVTATIDNGSLKVSYNIVNPLLMPNVTLTFPQPVDLSNLQNIIMKVKTANASGSVSVRVDLVDVNGMQTNVWPVFFLIPIYSDNIFHGYTWDYSTHWVTSTPVAGTVNKALIKQVVIYINAGGSGIANKSDVLWIDDIKFASVATGIETLSLTNNFSISPNPFSNVLKLESKIGLKSVKITDLVGKTVFETNLNGELNSTLQLSNLFPGYYLLNATSVDNKQICKKIVKTSGK